MDSVNEVIFQTDAQGRLTFLNRAWGEGGLVTDRTIDVHIKSLRRKFGKFEFIETVRGIGYRAREL